MYNYVEARIAYLHISKRELATRLNITYNTLLKKLKGSSYFTLDEAIELKKILKTDMSVEELFTRNASDERAS